MNQQKDIKPEQEAAERAAMAAAMEAEELSEETKPETDTKAEEEKDPAEDQSDAAEKEAAPEKDPRDEKIAELSDKVMRQMAEFDNYRRRTDKEKSEMFDMGMRSMVEKILPVVDNFERGLAATPESPEAKAYADGMNMVYRQMMKALEDAGVKAIDCLGKEFDPNLHNAVMHEEDDSGEENIVSKELQKGYLYKDCLVRPSMVAVKN